MTDTPQAPFAFMPAKAKGAESEPAKPARARKKKSAVESVNAIVGAIVEQPARKRRARRTRAVDDVAVLKACVKYLRKAEDAQRVIATLRIMFE